MEQIFLKRTGKDGIPLEAIFSARGMNLQSFKRGGVEVIEQSTKSLFEERFAGLGSLIGPHFHHRNPSDIPMIPGLDKIFPHLLTLRQKGVLEPFSHGIARYVPWKYRASETQVVAKLKGSDLYQEISLKALEGFDFEIEFQINLREDGLLLNLAISSEKPSLVGLHYYYALPKTGGRVRALIEKKIRTEKGWEEIPSQYLKEDGSLEFDAALDADFGFIPKEGKNGYEILYENETFTLNIQYKADIETSWQIYHPKDAAFLCLEPLSSQNPRTPHLCNSHLEVKLQILDRY